MALGALGQVHISVSDVERSVAWYRDVLGLTHLFTVPGQPMAFFASGDVRRSRRPWPTATTQELWLAGLVDPDGHRILLMHERSPA
jgi:catechol 2,3-dioxygenase-like lactoylglutathione lyase family enzyme